MSGVSIHNTDCMKFFSKIPNQCIDLILTDPPYNISKFSSGNISLPNRKPINNDISDWDKIEIDQERLSFEFLRIIKPTGNIFIFTGYNQFGTWYKLFKHKTTTFQYFVWHKINPTPKVYKNGFLNSCELVACIWNKGHTWNFTNQNDMHNCFSSPICSPPERLKDPFHPAQKPVKLLKYLIKVGSNANDIVFDPFMGVGSTGVAAVELGRRFGGIEIDTAYFNAAKKRIDTAYEVSKVL